ncbi:histidine kinase [Sphingomonas spermidinifaciens]|uniref:histidine kinase n=1 Tax=Sphingomonas spermidinifaciens TaxID=1141889 RepID=A0A2A4B6D1_9SPHN|nr:histidine kinase [Sphingomonas spermidinifaciens]PCD03617.1 histidine kinase [Sphingomonas spermidinifaciens]
MLMIPTAAPILLAPELPADAERAEDRAARHVGWSWRSVLAVIAIWTAAGVFQAVPDMIGGIRWDEVFAKFVETWSWALLTPAILLVDRALTRANPQVLRLAVAHLLLSVPFSIVHTYVAAVILYPVPSIWWNPLRSADFGVYFYLGGWITYCAFVGVLQALKFHGRLLISQVELERVEKRLVETRLDALRLQLEPHFLFNSLNAISSEVAANPALAREMIEDLGALLRHSLDCQNRTEISLAQELALLDRYIAIQKHRFGERIQFRIEADPATLGALVPSLFLQPLVENSVRHGLERRLGGGEVVVTADRVGDELEVRVADDGVGLPPHWLPDGSAGLGVRVTRERLQALYGGSGGHEFSIARRPEAGTEVRIRLPYHDAAGDAGA